MFLIPHALTGFQWRHKVLDIVCLSGKPLHYHDRELQESKYFGQRIFQINVRYLGNNYH